MADPELDELLRALGPAEPPGPGALEAAREVLWSAVAGEMLAVGPAGGAGRARPGTAARPANGTRRRGQPGA